MDLDVEEIKRITYGNIRRDINARLDELRLIAQSDKGTSDFNGWDWLDKRTKELNKKLSELGE